MPKKIIILLAFILFSQEKALSINPVWKSIIFPGWGEHVLEENKRSRLFSNIELSLWTACLGAYTYSHHSMLQYKSFAVEHAGVCLLYTSPSPRDATLSRMPSSA